MNITENKKKIIDAISKIETLLPENEIIEKFNIFISTV